MKSKSLCTGCINDPYNHGHAGVRECWNFKDAKIVLKKEVYINQCPPWNQKPKKFLNCYKKPGYIYVDPDVIG